MSEKKLNDEKQDLLQKFLDQSLTETEKAAFERHIQESEAFAEEVATAMAINRAYEEVEKEELQDRLRQLEQDRSKRRSGRKWLWGLILILVAFLSWLLFKPSDPVEPSSAAPVAENPHLDPLVKQNRDDLSVMGSNWPDDLLRQQYIQAIPKLEAELEGVENLSDRAGVAYWLGLLYLYAEPEQPELDRAIYYLRAAKDYKDAPAYLLIAFEKASRLDEARSFFERNPGLRSTLPDSLRKLL